MFTCMFHAKFEMITDSYYQHLLIWERHTSEWEPLCSHLPLAEKMLGNLDLSAEELEIIAALRHEHRNQNSRNSRERKRKEDIDAYRAHGRVTKNAWSAKSWDKLAKRSRDNRAKALSEKLFHCKTWDMSLQAQAALDSHLKTQSHADRLAGIVKPEMSEHAIDQKNKRAAAKAKSKHHCGTCNEPFDTDWAINRHNDTPRRKKRVEALRAS